MTAHRVFRLGFILFAFLLALGVPPEPAHAYVRSRAEESCLPVYWKQTCVFIQPDANLNAGMPASDAERIIQKSISNWMSRTTGSFMKLNYVAPDGPKEVTYKDHLSVIVFRTGNKFCRPAVDGAEQVCYDPSAAAVTTVSYINKKGDPNDGWIVDADIEMNSVNNQFVEIGKPLPLPDSRNQTDLENTLTHELGHLLGLDHTCRLSADPACLTDNNGQARLTCESIDRQRLLNPTFQTIYETAMFAVAPPKDIEKRTPKADDIAGIAAVSPLADDPKVCQKPGTEASSGCSCEVGHQKTGAKGAAFAILLFFFSCATRLRRKKSTQQSPNV
ncbi:MAG TPA: hypothetical protein PKE31_21045 [Pseudomonadota bacterium]|jgi:hypothetical protein|nr:hypothetical protein [Pseudomonadota bacterium]